MEGNEIHKLAALEDTHWWYRERRHLLRAAVRDLPTGCALDIGAAGGGNTRVLRDLGWRAIPLEYGLEGAQIAHGRGLPVLRADAMHLPLADGVLELVVAFDVLEHLADDHRCAREIRRVLRPGGTALVAVPCDPRLWSAHDEAVGHERRYTRATLAQLLERSGLQIDRLVSWNVLLRPVVALRRRAACHGSDLEELNPLVNGALRAVIAAERHLPVRGMPGVSLVATARRPA